MKLDDIVAHATNKAKFLSLNNYIAFCTSYLEFVETGLQARIVSQNESKRSLPPGSADVSPTEIAAKMASLPG